MKDIIVLYQPLQRVLQTCNTEIKEDFYLVCGCTIAFLSMMSI